MDDEQTQHASSPSEPDPAPGDCSDLGRALLALTMIPGLGPVRIAQLIDALGSARAVLGATSSRISRVRGIGAATAASIATNLHEAIGRVDDELAKIAGLGAHVVALGDPRYPPLLAQIPGAPPILMVRGRFDHERRNRYTVSIVGSRSCSVYGGEQAHRFGAALAGAGLTVISGGARGIDTAAHRGALSARGSTGVVLGCGLATAYPPENARLFDEIVASGGAIISELPIGAAPDAKNFPARNRIISGLSLGVVVIEAGRKSGALITARHAVEDHGREVMGVPGRVDSSASAGTHELLRAGAHLVTDPGEVIEILERDAFHLHAGTHGPRTADPGRSIPDRPDGDGPAPEPAGRVAERPIGEVDEASGRLLSALSDPRTADELAELVGSDPGAVRAKLTMLEIQGRIKRAGSRFVRVR